MIECMQRKDSYPFEVIDDVRLDTLTMSLNMGGLSLFVFVDGNFLFVFFSLFLHSELVRHSSVHCRLWIRMNLFRRNY